VYYPKRFEALRRFYCGTHNDFLKSIFKARSWAASGGKAFLSFYKTHDERYIFKEVKGSEFKMFLEFGPTYFDYMCKAFFHNYPCALAKILGAYVIKITSD
jgi:1-phosphatidylinositol-3-phosphate 5-kinase